MFFLYQKKVSIFLIILLLSTSLFANNFIFFVKDFLSNENVTIQDLTILQNGINNTKKIKKAEIEKILDKLSILLVADNNELNAQSKKIKILEIYCILAEKINVNKYIDDFIFAVKNSLYNCFVGVKIQVVELLKIIVASDFLHKNSDGFENLFLINSFTDQTDETVKIAIVELFIMLIEKDLEFDKAKIIREIFLPNSSGTLRSRIYDLDTAIDEYNLRNTQSNNENACSLCEMF
ncbi:hypothetical protein KJ644_03305 [Candidatus Dependentiae bacterium]|nr:hypothetical protein [Candidatus Dependentiae bacterium]MBU4387473.1 hypothetical protein [Candidatus Dependentiae bacterium]MCG2756500.1 hypothetical protein [Candidatus Dependentiae bacterium]